MVTWKCTRLIAALLPLFPACKLMLPVTKHLSLLAPEPAMPYKHLAASGGGRWRVQLGKKDSEGGEGGEEGAGIQ